MRHFLFLQGIPGPSLRIIAGQLIARGAKVSRINFNGGDWFNWRFGGTAFRGKCSNFADWLEAYCLAQQNGGQKIDALVLFGEARPLHAEAIILAKKLGLDVHVIEEGYLRPYSVTLESWPNGEPWSAPENLEQCGERAAQLEQNFEAQPCVSIVRRRVWEAITYWVMSTIFALFFARFTSHRLFTPAAEVYLWIRRMLRRGMERKASQHALDRLERQRFLLFPLQLDGDAALKTRSSFADMAQAAEIVIRNFARNAPEETYLLIKMHPFDPDFRGWRKLVDEMAARHQVQDRLCFIELGDLQPILKRCHGVVTVNSTVGQLALSRGVPVLALGRAHYAMQGLSAHNSLAEFWRTPIAPMAGAYDLYARSLWADCLVNGGFHSKEALELLAKGSVLRLLGEGP